MIRDTTPKPPAANLERPKRVPSWLRELGWIVAFALMFAVLVFAYRYGVGALHRAGMEYLEPDATVGVYLEEPE